MASAPFRCFLCERLNDSGSNYHAGSCRTCTCPHGISLLCEKCALRHVKNEFPGHEFWLYKDDPVLGPEEKVQGYGKVPCEAKPRPGEGALSEEDLDTDPVTVDRDASAASQIVTIRALQAKFNEIDVAIKSKDIVVVSRKCEMCRIASPLAHCYRARVRHDGIDTASDATGNLYLSLSMIHR